MRGTINGKKGEAVGVEVVDNAGIEHFVGVKPDGSIETHGQDDYPEAPDRRTNEQNERIRQVQQFAKYHVFRERGHLTLEPRNIPEWQATVASVVGSQSTESFAEQFDAYYRQFRSTTEDRVEPIVDVPEGAVAGLLVYLQHLYLDVDLEAVLEDDQRRAVATALETEADPETVAQSVTRALANTTVDPIAFSLADVSGIGALYQGQERDVTVEPDDPRSGPPDARLELAPIDPPWEEYLSPEGFHFLVTYHLLCQTRDCYLRLGLEPPEGLRILGFGKFRQAVRNDHLEMYDPVHYTDADVEGYSLPDLGPGVEL